MRFNLLDSIKLRCTVRAELLRTPDADLAVELLSPVPGFVPQPKRHGIDLQDVGSELFDPATSEALSRRLAVACELLSRRVIQRVRESPVMDSPAAVKEWLTLRCANLDHEVFMVLFLNSCNRVVAFSEMFRGTLNQISVYPREIVKAALAYEAAAVVIGHNHPSFSPEISRSDELITKDIRDALALVDIKLLDHFVVAGTEVVSFAEEGML